MYTFWYYVACVLYFLGGYRAFLLRWRNLAYLDYADVFSFIELLVVILLWPVWTAVDVIFRPLNWLLTHKWPVCGICGRRSRLVIGRRGRDYCPGCYKQSIDADEQVTIKGV